MRQLRITQLKKITASFLMLTFSVTQTLMFCPTKALAQTVFNLPLPGTIVTFSQPFTPPLVRGITLYPDNPLKFDFIVDVGDDHLAGDAFQKESMKLIKYFLVALTVPENDMWVNLSPYEKNRIVPEHFGKTEMGRDLLLQDYMLKQLTASSMNPEQKLGTEFWQRVREKAKEKFGATDVPMDTFNKVWIVPDKAQVYVKGQNVYVVGSHLNVMLEEDYLARESSVIKGEKNLTEDAKEASQMTKELIRDIIIPEIEKEVNEGKNFALLRQIQNSAILAAWYKKNLKQTLLGKVYVDQKKTDGINGDDNEATQKIYKQYLEAFKKGAYNFIKEDYDSNTQEVIPRKYFSGGIINLQPVVTVDSAVLAAEQFANRTAVTATVTLQHSNVSSVNSQFDAAMLSVEVLKGGKAYSNSEGSRRLALVDENGVVISGGSATQEEVHKNGLWHMSTHVYFFDEKGERIILLKRSQSKKSSAGKLQAITGHVLFGESQQKAAIRIAENLTGLAIDPKRLEGDETKTNQIKRSYEVEEGKNNEYTTVYFYRVMDQELEAMRLNYNLDENDEIWIVPMNAFETMLQEKPELFTNSLNQTVREHLSIDELKEKEAVSERKPIRESKVPEVPRSRFVLEVKGRSFLNPKLRFEQNGKPLTATEINSLRKRVARNAQAVRKLITKLKGTLEVEGHLRGADIAGSFLDLLESQRSLTPFGVRGFNHLPSTVAVASAFSTKIKIELADNPEAIVYVAPDYGYPEDKPLIVRGEVNLSEVKKGHQRFAPAFIFSNLFGLKGLKITLEGIPPMALAGGMESSNVFNVALVAAASSLSGANLSWAEIFNLSLKIENDELHGSAGGQGVAAAITGGVYQHIWPAGIKSENGTMKNPLSFLSVPLFKEGNLQFFENHMMLVQAGVEFKNGTRIVGRTADLTNSMWIDLLRDRDEQSLPYFHELLAITAQGTQAIQANDLEIVVKVVNQYVEIRDLLIKRWLELMMDAKNNVEGTPEYAKKYWAKVEDRSNDGYQVIRDIFESKGEAVLRETRLYSLEPIADLITAAKERGIAIMPLGAGGPGSNLIAIDPQGVDHLKEFLKVRGLAEVEETTARKLVRGEEDGTLKGYMKFEVGTEPMQFRNFDRLPAVETPKLPELKTVTEQEVGLLDAVTVPNLIANFLLNYQSMEAVAREFSTGLGEGLKRESNVFGMLPSYLHSSSGKEQGEYVAVSFKGNQLEVALVKLNSDGSVPEILAKNSVNFSDDFKSGSGQQLFETIAVQIKKLNLDPEKEYSAGFIFGFPLDQTSVNEGRLINWALGWNVSGVVGEEVGQMLNGALDKIGLGKVTVKALLNDTVGVHLSVPGASIGLILDEGFNISVLDFKTGSIVNLEAGGFGAVPKTFYDKGPLEKVDPQGEHVIEKMVSGLYLGGLIRSILVDLNKNGKFLKFPLVALNKEGIISIGLVRKINEANTLEEIKQILREEGNLGLKGAEISDEDANKVQRIVKMVLRRAGRLVASILVASIRHIDEDISSEHVVAVDGKIYPLLEEYVDNGIHTMLGEMQAKGEIILQPVADGVVIGGAISAAVAKEGKQRFDIFYHPDGRSDSAGRNFKFARIRPASENVLRTISLTDEQRKRIAYNFIHFRSNVKSGIWGGSWLKQFKEKLGWEDKQYTESWEVSMHPEGASVLDLGNGENLDITSIDALGLGQEFFGSYIMDAYHRGHIPFLAKMLDAKEALSLQVHPTQKSAELFSEKDGGKNETYFVLDTKGEFGILIVGFKEGASKEEFEAKIRNQEQEPLDEATLRRYLNFIEVRKGDIIKVPAGVIHAFQAGIQAMEISDPSNITYRLWDNNRPKSLGRTLQVEKALSSTDYDGLKGETLLAGLKSSWKPVDQSSDGSWRVDTVDALGNFHVEQISFETPEKQTGESIVKSETKVRFHVLTAIEGSVKLRSTSTREETVLNQGDTIFVPAAVGEYEVLGNNKSAKVLRYYPEIKHSDAAMMGNDHKNFLTLDDVTVSGKRMLIRPDINAPVSEGKISLTERMKAAAVTIKEAAESGAKVTVMAHQGRPGDPDYLESLEQHAQLLSELIGRPVKYVDDLYGEKAVTAIKELKDGEVTLLKNVRPQEKDPQFVTTLESLFDFFVLDGFSVAHRATNSVTGFKNIPNIAGRSMQKEFEGNQRFITTIVHPYVELLGGSKISDHVDALEYGLENGFIDHVLTGGMLGQLLLLIKGYHLGESTKEVLRKQDVDPERPDGLLSLIPQLKSIYERYQNKFETPIDLAYEDANGERQEILIENLGTNGVPFVLADNGTQTANHYAHILRKAKTVFVKGPQGNYKKKTLLKGSEITLNALAESGAFWMTGGGDTDNLVDDLKLKPSHRTLAGGAFLEFKAGKELPGIKRLRESAVEAITIKKRTADMKEFIYFGGNWKERKDISSEEQARAKAREFKERFSGLPESISKAKVIIFPEAKWVKVVADELKDTNISVGVQSLFFDPKGDLKVQINQAVEMGATYANVAHSMHRAKGLTNEQANKIMKAVLEDGRLMPWYTIEETGNLDPRDEISQAIDVGLKRIPDEVIGTFPTTLEPTVLISTKSGTGVVDPNLKVSGEDALLRSKFVREFFRQRYGDTIANDSNVGYGASVKSSNAEEIFKRQTVRNALIGGASLEANEFFNLVVNAMKGSNDAAMVAKVPGGIDLNANERTLEEQGDKINFPVPINPLEWQNFQTNGFIPVIINITPPTSLPLLLGAGTPSQSSESINVSSLN